MYKVKLTINKFHSSDSDAKWTKPWEEPEAEAGQQEIVARFMYLSSTHIIITIIFHVVVLLVKLFRKTLAEYFTCQDMLRIHLAWPIYNVVQLNCRPVYVHCTWQERPRNDIPCKISLISVQSGLSGGTYFGCD